MMPVRPPIRNMERKPRQKSIGDANEILPPYIVASQLKNLMPVGTETRNVAATKKRSCVRAHAHGEHVVRPDAEADEGDGRGGGGHEFVAEQHLAREDGDDLGHHAENRQDQDVDFRVAEEPEQVLPQVRRAAVLRRRKNGPRDAGRASTMTRDAVSGGMATRMSTEVQIHGPGEEREFAERHTGGPHHQDGGEEVDCRRRRCRRR